MKVFRSDWVLFGLAILTAVVAVALTYSYIEKQIEKAQENMPVKTVTVIEKPEMRPVLIANRELYRGELIEPADVRVIQVPKEGVVLKGIMSEPKDAVGLVANRDIYAGEWLVDQKFGITEEAKPAEPGVQSMIGLDMRAMRVAVSATEGLLGILNPGDFVDVISVFKSADGKRVIGRTVMQNVQVLSIGQSSRIKPDDETQQIAEAGTQKDEKIVKSSMVALHLSLRQAEELALASRVGDIHLVLRSPEDAKITDSDGVNVKVIESSQQKRHTYPSKSDRQTVQIYQGQELQEVKVR